MTSTSKLCLHTTYANLRHQTLYNLDDGEKKKQRRRIVTRTLVKPVSESERLLLMHLVHPEYCLLKPGKPIQVNLSPKSWVPTVKYSSSSPPIETNMLTLMPRSVDRSYEDTDTQAMLRSQRAQDISVDFHWVEAQSRTILPVLLLFSCYAQRKFLTTFGGAPEANSCIMSTVSCIVARHARIDGRRMCCRHKSQTSSSIPKSQAESSSCE